MNPSPHAWWDFGYAGIFACVFLEQIGVPIPAFPALLGAGALVASGELSLPSCLGVAVVAALAADLIWFGIGRVRGGKVLNLMCRLSWRPDTCVSKTKNAFTKHGTKTLLIAKFIPGLSTLAPPLAGMTQVPLASFVFYDGAGTVLWALLPLLAGAGAQKSFAAFQEQVYAHVGYLPWLCGFLIVAVLIWRYWNRRRYLQKLNEGQRGGINSEDLKRLLDQGGEVTIIDVRDELSARTNPVLLPTALWIPSSKLTERINELPSNKPIVTYCDCPNDESAVAAVGLLHQHGKAQARALLGGLDGWLAKEFATVEFTPVQP